MATQPTPLPTAAVPHDDEERMRKIIESQDRLLSDQARLIRDLWERLEIDSDHDG